MPLNFIMNIAIRGYSIMGYTNYWNQKRAFTDEEWSEIKDYIYKECDQNIIRFSSSYNAKQFKNKASQTLQICIEMLSPKDDDDVIEFNGHDPQSCENFTLHKNIREPNYKDDMVEFNFCKTRQFPYDEVVWKLLKFIKFEVLDPKDKSFSISNDNGESYE